MNLCLDIGNTRTKGGYFEDEKMVEKFTVENGNFSTQIHSLTNRNIQKVIFSTTANLPETISGFLKMQLNAIELTPHTPVPVKVLYGTPDTLGKDRLAAVVGAFSLFGGQDCLVADAGTCITYDWLDRQTNYLGGNIAPGLEMRLKAMHHFTAKLPLVAAGEIENPIGKTTETALRNGALWGALQEMEGYIRWGRRHFGKLTVVLTGGNADFFVKNMKRKIFVHPDLVLVGLNKILNFNAA